MRPLEILLSFANLLAFLGLALPLPQAVHWMRYSALIALLSAVLQAMIEGPRWQMVLAYILAVLFFLVWLWQIIAPTSLPDGQGQANRLVTSLGIGSGILGLIFSTVIPVLIPVFRFPHPNGPYEIGTLTYHWVDADRPEVFTANPNDPREIMAQFWYPTHAAPASPRAPYVQDANNLEKAFARVRNLPASLFGNLQYIPSNAIPYAPVAEDEPNYPVLIFLEGASGFRQMNTFQVEELVSHGYIVVALDQPYGLAATVVYPGGREAVMPPLEQLRPLIRQSYLPADRAPVLNGQVYEEGIIPYLARDVLFALDKIATLNQADPNNILAGRLDLQRIGTFGISGGGIVAGDACQLDPRLKACLVMDAPMTTYVVRTGIKQPVMWITRDAESMRFERERAGGWPEDEIDAHQTSMRAVYESLPGDGYFVQVDGIFHINFTDVPLWSPLFTWVGATGPIDAQRAFNIINVYSLAFFDRHLKGQPAVLLDGPAEQYPEVTIESRQP